MNNYISFQDVDRSSTLNLADMGKKYDLINGCFQFVHDDYCQYCPDDFLLSAEIKLTWWQEKGLMQTATGYGDKLLTSYVVKCADNKIRRVYCRCFSNVGSLFILVKGSRLYIHDYQIEEIRK